MNSLNHLFVIDPLEKLNKKLDSSLRLAFSLSKRGHNIYIATPKDIYWNMDEGVASLKTQKLEFSENNLDTLSAKASEVRKLSDFQAIYMRKDPPFDMDYIACTWLLDTAGVNTRIYNNPSALRSFNEKLLGFHYPEFCNKGLVSAKVEELLNYIVHECNGDAIIKPLDLFGGRGIERINVNELGLDSVKTLLEDHTSKGETYRLVQPFMKEIFDGEIRTFTFMGEIITSSIKVPAKGSYLANTSAGAEVKDYNLPKDLAVKITELSKKLLDKGIYMVGYDIIGDLVSEINITSPRLLAANIDDMEHFDRISDLIEKDLT